MGIETLFTLMLLALVVMAWWANNSKRNKIYCTLRRSNRTLITKFVKQESNFVIFEGRKFDVIPSCIVLRWWCVGLIHMVFPQWVPTLDFTYTNRFPLDPKTLKPVVISPEVRKAMNKEEWVKSYAKGFTPATSKKQSALQQYVPWVAIILVLIVAVYFNNQMMGFGATLDTIVNKVNAITK